VRACHGVALRWGSYSPGTRNSRGSRSRRAGTTNLHPVGVPIGLNRGGVWVGRRGPAVETGGPYAGLRPVWGGSVHWGGELGQAATCGRPLGKPATEDGWDAEE